MRVMSLRSRNVERVLHGRRRVGTLSLSNHDVQTSTTTGPIIIISSDDDDDSDDHDDDSDDDSTKAGKTNLEPTWLPSPGRRNISYHSRRGNDKRQSMAGETSYRSHPLGNRKRRKLGTPEPTERRKVDFGPGFPEEPTPSDPAKNTTRGNISVSPPMSRTNRFDRFINHGADQPRHSRRRSTSLSYTFDISPIGSPSHPKTRRDSGLFAKAPYYDDIQLQVTMYRGPGYERFPVVLGTVAGHQELCDKWDAEQHLSLYRSPSDPRQRSISPLLIERTNSKSSNGSGTGADGSRLREEECLASIRNILPDIDREFVRKKLQKYSAFLNHNDDDCQVMHQADDIAQEIIEEILEMDSYPKETAKASDDAQGVEAEDGTGVTIRWDQQLPKSETYAKDAVIMLARTFDHVPTVYIAKVVAEKGSIFAAYVCIHEHEDVDSPSDRPYSRLRRARTRIERKYQLTYSDEDHHHSAAYANQVNELQAAKQHVARRAIRAAEEKAKSEHEADNLAKHKASGAVMECQCCFDDEVPLNRLVSCTAEVSHFFCYACVRNLADTQIGSMRYELQCMDGSGCTSELSEPEVRNAIPTKTFDRLQWAKQQAEIIAAGIEGLEECPFCDYKAVCGDISIQPSFECKNPDCSRVSCRKCHKDDHAPKTCEEMRNDNILSARHLVEEAMSEAVMRTCPTCKVKIIKEYGCNKMVCTKCRTMICYVCKANLSQLKDPYQHFHTVPPGGGKVCTLHDRSGVDRHETEANEAETEAIKQAKEKDAEVDPSKLRITTDDTGKRRQPASAAQPAGPVRYPFLAGLGPPEYQNFERLLVEQDGLAHPNVWAEVVANAGLPELLNHPINNERDDAIGGNLFPAAVPVGLDRPPFDVRKEYPGLFRRDPAGPAANLDPWPFDAARERWRQMGNGNLGVGMDLNGPPGNNYGQQPNRGAVRPIITYTGPGPLGAAAFQNMPLPMPAAHNAAQQAQGLNMYPQVPHIQPPRIGPIPPYFNGLPLPGRDNMRDHLRIPRTLPGPPVAGHRRTSAAAGLPPFGGQV
ncbi:hypothetical protein HRR83_004686 [Exophiala dermatitidis]|uniref:RING-type domain-containing protein n=1 Tax=Exophiala dermatitidis TaxID=5970 RepID=A0AAN6EZL9_EXODE|nr:hypothetical protein HRR74_004032 [Exophiala dermatitidis]KAJ4529107.1 hypothetical protein HRR73_000127 [Exophiala dermatitidis]KAJ4538506.1 hypothetical protein HRR77_006990 [Exophiala dermatitidis]KAJ4544247.1 hypothetical protein HRR76_002313 [Exophiala dermatitidis]KAJ4561666.1 hypothetical protein HRR79_007003 [Exophiala dermatitidis]